MLSVFNKKIKTANLTPPKTLCKAVRNKEAEESNSSLVLNSRRCFIFDVGYYGVFWKFWNHLFKFFIGTDKILRCSSYLLVHCFLHILVFVVNFFNLWRGDQLVCDIVNMSLEYIEWHIVLKPFCLSKFRQIPSIKGRPIQNGGYKLQKYLPYGQLVTDCQI